MKINVNKTKVCVFEKRKQNRNVEFYINNELIETVDNFTYLGVNFLYSGNMSSAVKMLHDQALRAYNSLLSLFDRVQLDVKTKLSLFNTMIVPILVYGSEVWGVYNFKEVDKLQIRFLKHLLCVKKQTPNNAVYGEFGEIPLSIICKEEAIKFWLKIMKNGDSPMNYMYHDQCNNINGPCWAIKMKSIINHLGLNFLIDNFDVNAEYFSMLKSRLRDQFIQDWRGSIQSMSKLDVYCALKTNFKYEEYLDKIENENLHKPFSSIRLSAHKLEIEVGRYTGIVRENRICKCCNSNIIENEYHFLLCCSKYRHIRLKYLGNISWPNLDLFKRIMLSKRQIKIAKFIKEAMELRNTLLIQ